jgi:DNA repair ATPase RecN
VSRSIDDIYSDDDFLGFVDRGIFSALEVRSLDTAKFFDGKHTTQDGTPIPGMTCVRSSDAHSHEHIVERSRATWILVEEPSFNELKAALSFPHRVALEAPLADHAQILGMHVAGQFLVDEWIAFSPAMNCFIGCKGTGKTAVLECLRFLLGSDVPKERQKSVGEHISHILGASGSVECLVRTADGTEYLLVRRANSQERLLAIDGQGVSREVKHPGEVGFDASILGWHEIEGVADHAQERVRLIDHIEDPAEIADQIRLIDQSVESARDLLPVFQRKIRRLDQILKEWWHLKKKRATLKKLEDASLFDLQNKYESYVTWEQRLTALVAEIAKACPDISTSMGNKLQPLEDTVGSPVHESSGLYDAVNRVRGEIASIRRAGDASLVAFADACSSASAAIDQECKTMAQAFLEFRQTTYEPTVAKLSPEDREILSRQIQTIEETKTLPQVEQRCKNTQREVSDLARNLHSFCEIVCTARERIAQVREQRIAGVNAESSSIRLKLLRSSDHARREQFQKSYREDGAAFTSFIDGYEGSHSYQKLERLFASFIDLNTEEESWSVKDLLWDAKFVEFLRVVDDDDVEIALVVGKAGPTAIQNLSAGQRCTAVFPLLLRNNRKPLVIDQPEDNLDNRYIADAIAPELLNKKRQQQFILTSHNANLVVLTDAELICQFDSDGRTGTIRERGFLACGQSRVKSAVVEVLDGGEIALEARRRKYGYSQ